MLPQRDMGYPLPVRGWTIVPEESLPFLQVTDDEAVRLHRNRHLHTVGVSGSSPLAPTNA